jgi:hypothetical protein
MPMKRPTRRKPRLTALDLAERRLDYRLGLKQIAREERWREARVEERKAIRLGDPLPPGFSTFPPKLD